MDRAVNLINREVSEGRTANELPILLQDFCCHGLSNVSGGSKVSTKDEFIFRECLHGVAEHYPVVPAIFAYLADVSCSPFHYCLGDFTASRIYVIGSVGVDHALQFDAMVP